MWLIRRTMIWLALAVCGCSLAPPSNPLPDPPREAVGVVSLLGTRLETIHVGDSSTERSTTDVAEWQIDRLVATGLVKLLQAQGSPARPVLSTEPIERFYLEPSLSEGTGELDFDALIALGKKARVATLVVVHRIARNARDPHQRSFEGSYGLYYRSLFGIRRSTVYTLVGIEVIDVSQSRIVAHHQAPAWDGWDDELPAWAASFGDLTPQAQATVRRHVEKRLLERVQAAATELKP